jgi:hypothetical protein
MAGAFARKHMLSTQTLDMLADMRGQFGGMLADIGFVALPKGSASRGSSGRSKRAAHWTDEGQAAYNQHAFKPAVVRRSAFETPACDIGLDPFEFPPPWCC